MKNIFSTLVFSLLFYLNANSQITVEKERVSPNFVGFKGVLLLYKSEYKLVDKALENRFEKFYKGEYKILDKETQKDLIYKDTQKYPFIVQIKLDRVTSTTSFFIMVMTDRLSGKTYETTTYPDNTIPPYSFINKYAKALEKIRNN